MNKPLDATELKALEAAFPITEPKLTRRQKLLRLAMLVEGNGYNFDLFHNLERRSDDFLASHSTYGTPLALVERDDVFQKDGFKGHSVKDARDYLELTTPELHEFSCDCGGSIGREKMAARIRNLAGPESTPTTRAAPGIVGRMAGAVAAFFGAIIMIG